MTADTPQGWPPGYTWQTVPRKKYPLQAMWRWVKDGRTSRNFATEGLCQEAAHAHYAGTRECALEQELAVVTRELVAAVADVRTLEDELGRSIDMEGVDDD